MPSPEKEKKKNRKKEEKKKDCPTSLAEAVSQGFAGENYARRASFLTGKRRSRLTLTGRRRQATLREFLFLDVVAMQISKMHNYAFAISSTISLFHYLLHYW